MILQKASPLVRNAIRRSSFWRPSRCSNWDVFDRFERDFHNMDRFVDRAFRMRPFFTEFIPQNFSRFDWDHPIVEEDGKKKFKLSFDVGQFKPVEIEVKTSKGKLIVQAKHESKDDKRSSKMEYYREMAIPEGVKLEDMTCKYLEDGNLLVEAPYSPPEVEHKEQPISIKHEK